MEEFVVQIVVFGIIALVIILRKTFSAKSQTEQNAEAQQWQETLKGLLSKGKSPRPTKPPATDAIDVVDKKRPSLEDAPKEHPVAPEHAAAEQAADVAYHEHHESAYTQEHREAPPRQGAPQQQEAARPAEAGKPNPFAVIEKLPPLQAAVLYAEILPRRPGGRGRKLFGRGVPERS
ncbi:MAG: hypothetical protein RDV41_11400 [Planctomycetota bacterium]|nr:hypothetical protein [Planctomycetota bacterium]